MVSIRASRPRRSVSRSVGFEAPEGCLLGSAGVHGTQGQRLITCRDRQSLDDAAGDEASGAAHFTGTIIPDGTLVVEPEETIVDGILEARGGSSRPRPSRPATPG
jgi:hypothetical protein